MRCDSRSRLQPRDLVLRGSSATPRRDVDGSSSNRSSSPRRCPRRARRARRGPVARRRHRARRRLRRRRARPPPRATSSATCRGAPPRARARRRAPPPPGRAARRVPPRPDPRAKDNPAGDRSLHGGRPAPCSPGRRPPRPRSPSSTSGSRPIGPELLEDFDLTLFELGAVLTAGLLGAGVALVGAGILVDRIGARRAMLVGTAIGTAGLASLPRPARSTSSSWALVVFGIGSAVVPIAGTGALFRAYPACPSRLGARRAADGRPSRRCDRRDRSIRRSTRSAARARRSPSRRRLSRSAAAGSRSSSRRSLPLEGRSAAAPSRTILRAPGRRDAPRRRGLLHRRPAGPRSHSSSRRSGRRGTPS